MLSFAFAATSEDAGAESSSTVSPRLTRSRYRPNADVAISCITNGRRSVSMLSNSLLLSTSVPPSTRCAEYPLSIRFQCREKTRCAPKLLVWLHASASVSCCASTNALFSSTPFSQSSRSESSSVRSVDGKGSRGSSAGTVNVAASRSRTQTSDGSSARISSLSSPPSNVVAVAPAGAAVVGSSSSSLSRRLLVRPITNGHGASTYSRHATGSNGMYVCGHSNGWSNAINAAALTPRLPSLRLTRANRNSEVRTSIALTATSTPTRRIKAAKETPSDGGAPIGDAGKLIGVPASRVRSSMPGSGSGKCSNARAASAASAGAAACSARNAVSICARSGRRESRSSAR